MTTHDSLYVQLLEDDYDRLDPVVQRFHTLRGHMILHGRCLIDGPTSILGRCLAWFAGVPSGRTEEEFTFELLANEHEEQWTRYFPTTTMCSRMHIHDGELVERLGPVTFHFHLHAVGDALEMELASMTVLGVPWPRRLKPEILARETGEDGLFHFEVSASLPMFGRVTAYKGTLVVP